MPKKLLTTKKRRNPVKRERLAGLTVTVQNCNRKPYDFVVIMRRNGTKIRARYLRTKAEAESIGDQWSTEAGNTGAETARSITDGNKRALMQWREQLAPYGKTPQDAVAFFLAHLERCKVSMTVEDLSDRLQTQKGREKKSRRYLDDMRLKLERFCEDFGKRIAADVSTEDISTWLARMEFSPVTVANYRRLLSVLFSHAVTLRACERNPVKDSFKPEALDGEIGILTVAECAALLTAAHERPEILPAVAIGMFAGVRDAELHRLDWSEIKWDAGFIEIKASKAKSARRRLIEMQPALRAWLEPLRCISGPLWPGAADRGRKLHEAARRAMGFGKPGTETDDETKAGIKLRPWPHNALRHSYASYHIGKFQDAPKLALQMGHTSAHLVFQHYREIVLPDDAEAFWNLTPAKVLPAAGRIIPLSPGKVAA